MHDTKANTGYRWIDKDPVLDLVNHLIENSGKSSTFIANKSGVSVSTINAWRKGKTRRPQAVTIKFVLNAIGCELGVRQADGTYVPIPLVGHNSRSKAA